MFQAVLHLLSAAALAFGAALGLYAMIRPTWAARLARLQPSPSPPGGFAEFRATYGGFFFGSHATALVPAIFAVSDSWASLDDPPLVGVIALAMALPLSAGWLLTAAGRVISIAADGTRTRFNVVSAGVEAAVGLLIGAPLLRLLFRDAG